jgi:hypothetical protein
MNSATEGRGGTILPAVLALLACALLPAIRAGADPAASPGGRDSRAAGPADLRKLLDRAVTAVDRAAGAMGGTDAGRVSLLLVRADEAIARFEEASRLAALLQAFEEARAAAGRGDLGAGAVAVDRARERLPALADYVVTRQAEESGRAALRAARAEEVPAFLAGLEHLEAAVLAPALLARIREARQAIARGRAAMVRRDMKGGAAEVAAAGAALGGVRYSGALSRATFALAVGSELLRDGALIAARDQARRALRDLRLAIEVGPEEGRAELQQARDEVAAIWKRMRRVVEGDDAKLEAAGRRVDAVRRRQRG